MKRRLNRTGNESGKPHFNKSDTDFLLSCWPLEQWRIIDQRSHVLGEPICELSSCMTACQPWQGFPLTESNKRNKERK